MVLFNQNKNFEQTQFWTEGVARFYLDLWRAMLCKIENDFYSLAGFHCEYLRTQNLGNLVFYIKQHVSGETVLKSGCVQFLNLLAWTEMGSVSVRKCFTLTHILSLPIFECWKIRKCWFSRKIMHLSGHSFKQWAWPILTFSSLKRDAWCGILKMVFCGSFPFFFNIWLVKVS